jgi:hypothetical protein
MADAVTSQILVDGERNAVMKFTNISDGTGEAAVLKVDVSTLVGAPSSVKITQVEYDIFGMQVAILWDATTDVPALVLGQGQQRFDFTNAGGLINNGGAGVTGDILFTTIGASANDTYSIVLHMKKS